MKKIHHVFFVVLSLLVIILGNSSCSSYFLQTTPTSQTTTEQLKQIPSANKALLNGIYTHVYGCGRGTDTYGHSAIALATDLMHEDIVQSKNHWFGYDYNLDFWQESYRRVSATWDLYYKDDLFCEYDHCQCYCHSC